MKFKIIINTLIISYFGFFLLFNLAPIQFAPNQVLAQGKKEVRLKNPLEAGDAALDPAVIIGLVIKAVLGVVGGLTLLMLVWGGFQWVTAAGTPEKIKKGSQTMIWAIIGLILTLGSYVIVNTFFDFLTGAKK